MIGALIFFLSMKLQNIAKTKVGDAERQRLYTECLVVGYRMMEGM
jgi:hypothetical protein